MTTVTLLCVYIFMCMILSIWHGFMYLNLRRGQGNTSVIPVVNQQYAFLSKLPTQLALYL